MAKKSKAAKKAPAKKVTKAEVALGPIAKFVSKKMTKAGLNPNGLSALTGVPAPAVYRFLYHGRNLHVDHVTTLLEYFGVKF